MSDPYGSFEKPSPYGDAPFAGQQRPSYGPPHGQAPYGQNPYGQQYGAPAPRDPDRRPGTVLAAGLIAIVSSSLVALLSLCMIVGGLVARHWFADEFRTDGYTTDDRDTFVAVLLVAGVIMLLLCVGGILCGIFTLRRSNAARIVLVVLSGITIIGSLLTITGVFPIATMGAAIATIVLVFVGGANEWFRPKPVVMPYRQGPGYPGPGQGTDYRGPGSW